MGVLRIEALGALRVESGEEVALTRPARRRLLSILLLERGGAVTVPELIDRMWGDHPPGDPRNAVQAHIGGLRRQLGAVIRSAANAYSIDVNGHWFDVDVFLEHAAELDRGRLDDDAVAAAAAAALALWRGAPFPDLAGDEFARGRIEGLVETRRRIEARWFDALLATGRVEEGLPELERLVIEQPYEERFWERLMLARYRIGNTAEALRAFQDVRRLLGEELGVEPGARLRHLEEQILLHDPRLGSPPAPRTPHNLPAVDSSFVGRDADTAAVASLLASHRLVTITGGPGLGKTRLGLEVARNVLENHPGGVWLVRLAAASSEADVTATIAAAMGVVHDVADPEELGSLVGSRPQLVLLDNCEHVLDSVRRFARSCLRDDGPLRLLATSRHRLGLSSEEVWLLEPLSLPAADGSGAFESDAVRLLMDRAASVDRSFRAREADPVHIAALCRHTDGIPLALELAASWLPSVGVLDAMEVAGVPAPAARDDFDPHHRSLRAAVDWSFELLSLSDRPLVAAASVFRGSFSLDAFRTVCSPDLERAQAAAAVSRLVDASLLAPERPPDGSLRYRMLEPVREFALERLEREEMVGEVRDRHACWYLERAIALGKIIDAELDPAEAQVEVDLELADHRAAMRWLLDSDDPGSAARLATALTGYWFARYLGSEAIRWLAEALAAPLDDSVRVPALWTAGWAAYSKADYPAAAARYEECRMRAAAGGDRLAEGRALFGLGRIELPRDPVRGREYIQAARAAFGAVAAKSREEGDCLIALGISAAMGGQMEAALDLLGRAEEIMERRGSVRSLSIIHRYRSLVAWYAGNEESARTHVDRAERLARRADDRPAVGGALIQRSLVECRWGDPAAAAAAMREAIDQLPPRHEIDHCLVFVGALPVLLAAGEPGLAARLLAHLDRVYGEYGWVPVDERMPAVREFRVEATAACEPRQWDPVTSAEMADVLRPVLTALAAGREERLGVQ